MLPHADDLTARLQSLAVDESGQYCVFSPERHYVDSDPEDGDGSLDRSRTNSFGVAEPQLAEAGPPTRNGFVIPSIFVSLSDGTEAEIDGEMMDVDGSGR